MESQPNDTRSHIFRNRDLLCHIVRHVQARREDQDRGGESQDAQPGLLRRFQQPALRIELQPFEIGQGVACGQNRGAQVEAVMEIGLVCATVGELCDEMSPVSNSRPVPPPMLVPLLMRSSEEWVPTVPPPEPLPTG